MAFYSRTSWRMIACLGPPSSKDVVAVLVEHRENAVLQTRSGVILVGFAISSRKARDGGKGP